MARILVLNPPFEGMSTIVNVLGRVGPKEPNNPDDVRVVQRLLQMGSRGAGFATSMGVPQPTGRFDAVTGFWIFYAQNIFKARHGEIVDGVVSPAHGAHYAPGGGIWTIVIFNFFAKQSSPADYATFLAQSST
jgi:hypothetical protein